MTTLALLLPLLALGGIAHAKPRGVQDSLQIENGLNRGKWGPTEICDLNSYVFAFEIKYSGLGYLDDTSVNAIRLYCEDGMGSLTNILLSSEGSYGQWKGMRTCPRGEYMSGLRANVVPDQGALSDDLGMDNLQMRCSGGQMLDGLYGMTNYKGKDPVVARQMTHIDGRPVEAVYMKFKTSAQVRDLGDWGMWRSCSSGNKVCGLQTRLEDNHPLDDDAGVTDVVMFCCN